MRVISEWKQEIKCRCGSIIEVSAYDIKWNDEKYLCYFECPICFCDNFVNSSEIPSQIFSGAFHEYSRTFGYSTGRIRKNINGDL